MNTIVLQYPETLVGPADRVGGHTPAAGCAPPPVRCVPARGPAGAGEVPGVPASPYSHRSSRRRPFRSSPSRSLSRFCPYAEGQMTSRGLDIVLVLDLSLSMQELMGQPGVMPIDGTGHARDHRLQSVLHQHRPVRHLQDGAETRRHGHCGRSLREPARSPGSSPKRRRLHPRRATRLETTKRALIEFIARRRDDRIGLVVFSEHSVLDQSDDVRSRVLDAVRGARRRQDPAGRSDDGHRRRCDARQQPARAPVERAGCRAIR